MTPFEHYGLAVEWLGEASRNYESRFPGALDYGQLAATIADVHAALAAVELPDPTLDQEPEETSS